MPSLDSWTRGEHRSAGGDTRPTYRKGTGPGVVLIHELPGITPDVVAFGDEVVAAGFTVVMPVLFGTPGTTMSPVSLARSLAHVCTSAEFTKLATGRTAPVADWLRSLARELHAELGGPGVGALGMCFTGGYALAMMVDDAVAAPVLAQPAAPFAVGKRRAADLGLSSADQDKVVARAEAGCPVLGSATPRTRRSAPASRRCTACWATGSWPSTCPARAMPPSPSTAARRPSTGS